MSTFFLLPHATAASYDVDALGELGASTMATVEPAVPVPEPAPGALLVAGLAALSLLGRWRRRAR